jgi:Dinitrogenase iron-molybdenum cofactor
MNETKRKPMSEATGGKGSEYNNAKTRRGKMKIAVSSTGKNLESSIDPRFGRCAYFLIVETDSMNCEVLDNQSAALGGGAGIQSAQFIASKGVSSVITAQKLGMEPGGNDL